MTRTLFQAKEELEADLASARWEPALNVCGDILAAVPGALGPRFVLADLYGKAGHVDHAVHLYRLLADHCTLGGLPLRAVVALKALESLSSPDPRRVHTWAERYSVTSVALAKVVSRPGAPDPDIVVPQRQAPGSIDEAAQQAFAQATDPALLPQAVPYVAPIPLLSELSTPALAAVYAALQVRRVPPSTALMQQGEPGDSLLFIASGEVIVYTTDSLGAHRQVARVSEGTLLGEMALVSAEPRSASVVTATGVDACVLGRDALTLLAATEADVAPVLDRFARERMLKNVVATSPLFAPFSHQQRGQLLARFKGLEYEPRAVLLAEGQPGPGLFIVLMGEVEVASQSGGAAVPLARLHSGDAFGEMSLLGGGATSATVTAVTPTTVLFLPKDDFVALVDGVPALLAHFATLANRRAAAQSTVLGRSGDLEGPDLLL